MMSALMEICIWCAHDRIVRQVGVVNTSVSAIAMASGGRMEHALLLAGFFLEAGHQVGQTRGRDKHLILVIFAKLQNPDVAPALVEQTDLKNALKNQA